MIGKKDGMKQGPLGGALKDLGYTSEQVEHLEMIWLIAPLTHVRYRSLNSRWVGYYDRHVPRMQQNTTNEPGGIPGNR